MIGSKFPLPCCVLCTWQLCFLARMFEKSILEAERLLFMVCLGFVCLSPKTCSAFLSPACAIFMRDIGNNLFVY